ncbi:MAG: hypothetical protein HZB66_02245 [Candidatus Aenigmarchaeota archaeon]|nr:hypothetical protein [Candidatus Aenigmarchaeota archaeon]
MVEESLRASGKVLPELVERQTETAAKAADYFGVPVNYPSNVRFDPRLMGTSIGGYQTIDSRYGITVGYNPEIARLSAAERQGIADHEAVHVAQPGKEQLLGLYAIMNGRHSRISFPLGRAIVEGGAEYVREKIGRRGDFKSYYQWYELAKAIDKYVPLKRIYRVAEQSPENAVSMIEDACRHPDVQMKLWNAMLYSNSHIKN